MRVLHNRISNEELKQRMLQETEPRVTISFYQYFNISNPQEFRDALYLKFEPLKVFGRIYIASEGINAQISVPESNFEQFKTTLYNSDPALDGIRLNIAVDDDGKSFWVLRLKVRPQIVADGIEDPTFSMERKGKYLKAAEVNEMLEKEDVIVVDMRNHYEYEIGHFENAIEIPSDTFKQQLPMAAEMLSDKKDKNIVMYCTGGIRCEKASAYMLHHGFENVFHIEGGIIEYTNKAKEQGLPLKFKGKNFVFDERLGERITDDIIAHCHQCGTPCDDHTNCRNNACHLLFIQCKQCAEELNGCCSSRCKDITLLPIEEQEQLRKGIQNGQMIFTKSKDHPLRKHRDDWK
jgi:UPF0176 protein